MGSCARPACCRPQDKLDGFVPAHFIGWYLKTLMIRDWWMCSIVSVMFEFLEYSLEHQLPNFSECWWDHWIMDVLVCNGLGIYCGMKTLEWLSLKTYKWQGLWNIPTYKGKMKRIAFQFTPYSWVRFEWRPASSLRRWLAVCGIILVVRPRPHLCPCCLRLASPSPVPPAFPSCSSCWQS